MWKALLANLRVEHTDRSFAVRTDRFGTLADVASVVEAESAEAESRDRDQSRKPPKR
jgi:hypothetical protein